MDLEKIFRSAGYLFFAGRDGYRGVLSHKKTFDQFVSLSRGQAESELLARLKKILCHAYDTSSYYKRCWDELGFDSEQVHGVGDLVQLPLLRKDILEKYCQEIISSIYNVAELELSVTGGTTGRQCSFYRDYACSAARKGRQLGMLELCGYPLGTRCGLIWGVHEDLPSVRKKVSLKQRARKFSSGRETLCCSTMDESKLRDFYERLKKFRPEIIYGYPKAIAHLGEFIVENKLAPVLVDKVICTAERLGNGTRRMLSGMFEAEVYNLYCTREHGCIGFECSQHNGFHIDTGSVLVEVLQDGQPVPEEEVGDLVITDLLNYGMPFIRNKIGDRGALSLQPCSCGCSLPLLRSLDGRIADMLKLPDGRTVSGLMLSDMYVDIQAIRKFQVVQKSISEFHLKLVVTDEYDDEVAQRVMREARGYLGKQVDIQVNLYPDIANNPLSGKFQEVICEVSSN